MLCTTPCSTQFTHSIWLKFNLLEDSCNLIKTHIPRIHIETICSIPKGNLANKLETPIRKDLQQKNKVDIFASVLAGVMAGAVTQSVVAGSGGSVSYISSRSTWTPDTRDRNTENFSAASGLCLGVNRNVSLATEFRKNTSALTLASCKLTMSGLWVWCPELDTSNTPSSQRGCISRSNSICVHGPAVNDSGDSFPYLPFLTLLWCQPFLFQ